MNRINRSVLLLYIQGKITVSGIERKYFFDFGFVSNCTCARPIAYI